jgi:hypothetical protein
VVVKGLCRTIAVGSITRSAYEYWKKEDVEHEYVLEDLFFDDEMNIPGYADISNGKDWTELNDICSNFYAVTEASKICIYDNHGQVVLQSPLELDDLKGFGIQTQKNKDISLERGKPVFIGLDACYGLYCEGSFLMNVPFEPEKLLINYDSFCGSPLFYNVSYNGSLIAPNYPGSDDLEFDDDSSFSVYMPGLFDL